MSETTIYNVRGVSWIYQFLMFDLKQTNKNITLAAKSVSELVNILWLCCEFNSDKSVFSD